MLVRKKLTASEFSNSNLRYSEGCDCVQFSPDGGTTWIDQPANDPRTSDAYRLPPLTGSDKRCRAAKGMENLVRSFVDKRIEDITDAELAGSILGIVAFIPGFNVLWALILAFVAFAFTIAREVLEAAFTEAVYDELRCIFYCNIDDDGQMDAEGFTDAYAQLVTFDAVARTWIQAVMDLVGYVGLSDAGVALEGAADCDECECEHCFYLDLRTSNGSSVGLVSSGGSYVSGQGWRAVVQNSVTRSTYGYWDFGVSVNVIRIEMVYSKPGGSGVNNVNRLNALDPTATAYSTTLYNQNSTNGLGTDQTKGTTLNHALRGIGWDVNSGTNTDLPIVHGFRVIYTGSIPSGWSDNC